MTIADDHYIIECSRTTPLRLYRTLKISIGMKGWDLQRALIPFERADLENLFWPSFAG